MADVVHAHGHGYLFRRWAQHAADADGGVIEPLAQRLELLWVHVEGRRRRLLLLLAKEIAQPGGELPPARVCEQLAAEDGAQQLASHLQRRVAHLTK